MSGLGAWPEGARAAVSITVDNLGEAAEIELGLRAVDAPLGNHYSVVGALPIVLKALAAARLRATFFVEGINAEVYPDALASIEAAGHELAYHAWCHEDWSTLEGEAEAANLDRGLAAFREIGVEVVGFRPPGGRLTPRTLDLLASRGLRHCSPAGGAPGIDRIAGLREHLTQNSEPGGAQAVRAALLERVESALAQGSHVVLVLHTWMIELELDAVEDVLAHVRAAVDTGELWSAPCREVATWMAEHAASFADPPKLDVTSWTADL
jgi:peptidoglycan/xylan/chitin deacetylase (PgdA/CDA1 family)